ncbi:MAG: hypothetical protein GY810_01170 [Aureispira sp.]|nr:hypothetical protein [Aureispira sp.]
MYTPGLWVIIEITPKGKETFFRVFGTWRGGYLDGEHWRLNSGITEVEVDGDYYNFYGSSGSLYRCGKKAKGMSGWSAGIAEGIVQDINSVEGTSAKILDPDELDSYLEQWS